MRQDWIEFDGYNFGKFSVKASCIDWVSQRKIGEDGKPNPDSDIIITILHANDGSDYGEDMRTSEPYEQVKQKIMGAEKAGSSDVVVEYFTREDYEKILAVMETELKECIEDNADVERTTKIVDKLNEILKEDK